MTTLAGRAVAEQKLGESVDGVFYAPLDYCFAVRRVLRTLRPRVVAVLETEIWPNLWREVKRAGARLLVINGRISDRAFPRYQRLTLFLRTVLRLPDAVLAQDALSRQRYLSLGAPADKVRVGGNLKYDFDASRALCPPALAEFLRATQPAEIWIAASTMPPAQPGDPDEDEAVIEAFQRLAREHANLLLILVPRRPERFDAAAERLRQRGVRFLRRSALRGGERMSLPGVLLLDSVGELAGLFARADVVFMGGTLARRGGHNILEPASCGRAIIVGPHMENFPAIIEAFRQADAVVEIDGPEGLAPAVDRLLRDGGTRAALGERAREAASREQGATERALEEILQQYARAMPRFPPAWPLRVPLWLMSRLWLLGTSLKKRSDQARRVRLRTPVVSIGALSMGGAGKTPFAGWLAAQLAARGYRPAILMRGYRRRRSQMVVLPPGSQAPTELTGDEAQIHLLSGVAAVGIGADRAAVGAELEQRYGPDAIVLDDGFQHWRLERNLDLVLVDALDPFGEIFPLGRLREPPGALARADIIVISRAEGDDYPQLEAIIRRYNSAALICPVRLKAVAWVHAADGTRRPARPAEFRQPAAFCGLAQPESFWRTLRVVGQAVAWRRAFGDHHRYHPRELAELARRAAASGADALLTTQKDVINLPAQWQACLGPLPLYWLEIKLEVGGEQSLLAAVERRLGGRASAARPGAD